MIESDAVVQVAQRTSARHQMTRESTSKLFVPLAALVVLLAMALRRGMRPLYEAMLQIASRDARTLDSIDEPAMPREILLACERLQRPDASSGQRLRDAAALYRRRYS